MALKRLTVSWPRYIAAAYSLVGLAFLTSVADNHLGRINILPVAPTLFAILYLMPFIVALGVREYLSPRPGALTFLVCRRNLPVLFPMALLALFAILWSMHPSAYWRDDAKWIFIVPYGFLILVFSMILPCFPAVRANFHWFSFLGLLALSGSILVDAYYPMTFSVEPNRPAGFPGNSNWGALSLVMLASVTLRYDFIKRQKFDLAVLMVTALGVFLTLSRSGTANFLLLLLLYFWLGFIKQGGRRGAATAVASCCFTLLVIGAALPLIFMRAGEVSQSTGQYRLMAFLQGKLEDDGSSDSRIAAVLDGMRLIEQSPFVGYGTGYNRTMLMTPHNLYLKQWVDMGVFGLVAYLMLLGGSFWIFKKRRYAPGMALIGVTTLGSFFSHNILEQRSFLVTLGASATISLFEHQERRRKARLLETERVSRVKLCRDRAARQAASTNETGRQLNGALSSFGPLPARSDPRGP